MCRGPNYFEVDVDIASSRAAGHVVGLVKPVTTSLVRILVYICVTGLLPTAGNQPSLVGRLQGFLSM
jgi:hypothetical protein